MLICLRFFCCLTCSKGLSTQKQLNFVLRVARVIVIYRPVSARPSTSAISSSYSLYYLPVSFFTSANASCKHAFQSLKRNHNHFASTWGKCGTSFARRPLCSASAFSPVGSRHGSGTLEIYNTFLTFCRLHNSV